MSDEYLNFEQASTFLNTPRSTLYRWLKEGRVPGHKLGRQWRFLRSELDAFRQQPVASDDTSAEKEGHDALHDLLELLATDAPEGAHKEYEMQSAHDALLWDAFDHGASALHLQPLSTGGWSLVYREPSGLRTRTTLDAQAYAALVDEIEAGVPVEHRGPASTRSMWKLIRGEDRVLVQQQRVATALGPYWTFRLVRTAPTHHTLSQITRSPEEFEAIARFTRSPHGIVLIAGASGRARRRPPMRACTSWPSAAIGSCSRSSPPRNSSSRTSIKSAST